MKVYNDTIRMEDGEGNEMLITVIDMGHQPKFQIQMSCGDSTFDFNTHEAEQIKKAIDLVVGSFNQE